MSIIHDALKKVQASLDRSYGRVTKNTYVSADPISVAPQENIKVDKTVSRPAHTVPNQTSIRTLFIFGNVILVCAGIILVLVLKLLDQGKAAPLSNPQFEQIKTQRQALTATRQLSAPSAQYAAPSVQSPVLPASPSMAAQRVSPAAPELREGLYLSGTMLMDNQRVALINEDIYVIGDSVDGKEIVEISLKEVTLKGKNGELSTLKVLNRK